MYRVKSLSVSGGALSVTRPTAAAALAQVEKFEHDGQRAIEVVTRDGKPVSIEELRALAKL